MTHGSLFSGIGGFDLAAEWMGWENVFHCEWNEFGQRVLKYYFPKAISYEDITKTDFTIHRGRIDILTGGFPCQPYSTAGKRLGKEDDRHLWPEMLRAIREIQPRFVVGENVRGLVNWNGGLVFDEVQTDMEAEGYEVQPFLLPACAVNAPHRRDRVWFIAHRNSQRCNDRGDNRQKRHISDNIDGDASQGKSERRGWVGWSGTVGSDWNVTDTDGGRWSAGAECEHNYSGKRAVCKDKQNNRDEVRRNIGNGSGNRTVTDTERVGSSRKEHRQTESGQHTETDSRRWWQNFPTQSPICSRDDGLPRELDGITFPKWRNESIKAYGNAIVPQVAFQIFKAIERYENPTSEAKQ